MSITNRQIKTMILHAIKDYYFRALAKEDKKPDKALSLELDILGMVIKELTDELKTNGPDAFDPTAQ